MKRLSLASFLVFISVSIFAQFKPGDIGFDVNEYRIYKKAGVKTRSEILIDTSFGMTETKTSVNQYTKDGWLYRITYMEMLEGSDMNEDGILDTIKDEFTYYPDGKLRILSLYGYDLYPIETQHKYDKDGKLSESTIASAEPRIYSYEFDDKGRVTKRLGKAYVFEYDDEGNATDSMVAVDHETTYYTWNDKNQLVTEKFFMMGLFYYTVNYFYDEKGLLTGYHVYYDDTPGVPPTYTNSFYYNKKGLLERMVTSEESFKLEFRYEYSYY